MPVQEAAYELVSQGYLRPGDRVLDVGFGLGYGMERMASGAAQVVGIEVDRRAVKVGRELRRRVPQITDVRHYDGRTIPFPTSAFDVVSCVDVIEHVPDYGAFLGELIRVARRVVFLSTPSRRPEFTRPDGTPRNWWHLREWSAPELEAIVGGVAGVEKVEWHYLDASSLRGPFSVGSQVSTATMALAPALVLAPGGSKERGE